MCGYTNLIPIIIKYLWFLCAAKKPSFSIEFSTSTKQQKKSFFLTALERWKLFRKSFAVFEISCWTYNLNRISMNRFSQGIKLLVTNNTKKNSVHFSCVISFKATWQICTAIKTRVITSLYWPLLILYAGTCIYARIAHPIYEYNMNVEWRN